MDRVNTGIQGLDNLLTGGFPPGGLYLVSGGTGAGKTIMGLQFCVQGTDRDENSLFITLEERKEDIAKNAPDDLRKKIDASEQNMFFLDFTSLRSLSSTEEETDGRGILNVGVLTEILERWSEERGLKRCVIDGVAGLGARYPSKELIRSDIFRLGQRLKKTGLTTIMTIETTGDYPLSRYGVEEYISDGVLLLTKESDRRYLEVVKMRGTGFLEGSQSMEIGADGVHVYPMIAPSRPKLAPLTKESFGVPGVDTLMGGGINTGDVTLISGSPGSGKTLFGLQFAKAALEKNEKVLYITFKENRWELARNARNWGMDLNDLMKQGSLYIMDPYTIKMLPNKHLEEIYDLSGKAKRVVIDTINDYSKALNHPKDPDLRTYAEHVVGILKQQNSTALLLADSNEIMGSGIMGERHAMHLADNIILLRYLEYQSAFKRVISVLKKRSGAINMDIREFTITKDQISVGNVFEGVDGILSGKATRAEERIEKFFS